MVISVALNRSPRGFLLILTRLSRRYVALFRDWFTFPLRRDLSPFPLAFSCSYVLSFSILLLYYYERVRVDVVLSLFFNLNI